MARLGSTQRAVLEKLHRSGPMTNSEIAESLGIRRSHVIRITLGLESYGLIRRSGTKVVRGKDATLWEDVV